MSFFPGFEQRRVTVDDIAFNVRVGGNGSPLLLLHGYPQTHVTWHKLAPELARHFTVVCPDLKGYGDSDAPPPSPDSGNYSKRVMGKEMRALMATLGHRRFAVALARVLDDEAPRPAAAPRPVSARFPSARADAS
jgi:haloacetate dehalogenase